MFIKGVGGEVNMQLTKLATGQGYLKAGFLGFPKSGKTYTAVELAIGLAKFMRSEGPIVMFDTEGGSTYIAKRVKEKLGVDLLGVRSRNFDDMLATGQEAEKIKAACLIVDSVTHPWRELCDAYLKQVNDVRKKYNRPQQKRLEFQDWGPLKARWANWTDFYLNSQLSIIICGRAGFEYDYEDRNDGSGKDLIKTGIKMKTEGEFGFEPSLLVEMTRDQSELREGGHQMVHRCTILGDRFGIIDGKSKDNPTFEFFKPHVECLSPGAHTVVDTAVKSDLGLEDDDDGYGREKRQRVILCEEVQAEILRTFPGQTAAEKLSKSDLLDLAFNTRSWTKVEGMDVSTLKRGLAIMKEFIGDFVRYVHLSEGDERKGTLGTLIQQVSDWKREEGGAKKPNGDGPKTDEVTR